MNFVRKNLFWLITLLLILIIRLPSLFEQWWYLDENIYLAIGDNFAKGGMVYVDAWDHKPPFIYLVYAFNSILFGPSLFPIRLTNLLLFVLSVFSFYKIASYFTSKFTQYTSKNIAAFVTISYGVVSSLLFDGIVFNGENLFIPLVLFGFGCFLSVLERITKTEEPSFQSNDEFYNTNNVVSILGSISWGLASLTKFHAIFEIGALAFILIVLYISEVKLNNLKSHLVKKRVLTICGISLFFISLPWIISVLYYAYNGKLYDFYYAILQYNTLYVQTDKVPNIFGLLPVNTISWSLFQFLSGIILILIASTLYYFKQISKYTWGLIVWFIATSCLVLLPGRAYPHYFLQAIPALLLLVIHTIVLIYSQPKVSQKLIHLVSFCLLILYFGAQFDSHLSDTNLPNYFAFYTKFPSAANIKIWNENKHPYLIKQNALVEKTKSITKPGDSIYMLGSVPELYALTDTKNANKFLVDFHIQNEDFDETFDSIMRKSPKLVIIQSDRSYTKRGLDKLENLKNYRLFENINLDGEQFSFWVNTSL